MSNVIGLLVLWGMAAAGAQAAARPWWQDTVFYEIYPRSFADSNGDGIGDLNGITSKLDYLKDLGVGALWITPCFPSPQVDFGYDVADYRRIDPMYGNLADFDRLIAAAKQRGLRIVLDLVVNHTSDEHPWFRESASSRSSPKRDWYVWRDGRSSGHPPNNWTSLFGGSAWQFDRSTNQYYYHYFYVQQPDINWRNPAARAAMLDIPRFWCERGVAGFRLDAVDTLFEDPQLRDNPALPGKNSLGDPKTEEIYNKKLPEMHGVLKDLRRVVDPYGAVLVGETWTEDVAELKTFYGARDDELQMPMDLLFTKIPTLSANAFRKHLEAIESTGHWPAIVMSNHDIVRSYDRYGDGQNNDAIAKVLAVLFLTLKGTPIMYFGEEIGMKTTPPVRREDVRDPIGIRGWPAEKGRDGQRTPMQWDATAAAGFTAGKPWLPIPPTSRTHNVASEMENSNSILRTYQQILGLRHSVDALREGAYVPLNRQDPDVLVYRREVAAGAVLVALNFSRLPRTVTVENAGAAWNKLGATVLYATPGARAWPATRALVLPPFGAYVGVLGR